MIRDNLKLLDQIMQKKTDHIEPEVVLGGTAGLQQMRPASVYLPLPNHNYVQSGKLSVNGVPAKTDFYQIKNANRKDLKSGKKSNS